MNPRADRRSAQPLQLAPHEATTRFSPDIVTTICLVYLGRSEPRLSYPRALYPARRVPGRVKMFTGFASSRDFWQNLGRCRISEPDRWALTLVDTHHVLIIESVVTSATRAILEQVPSEEKPSWRRDPVWQSSTRAHCRFQAHSYMPPRCRAFFKVGCSRCDWGRCHRVPIIR